MFTELYERLIKTASEKFNLNPAFLKHVDTRLIVNALLLPNNYNVSVLKSKYDDAVKKNSANTTTAATNVKQRVDETAEQVTQQVIDKLNEKLTNALSQWEMVLKEKAKKPIGGSDGVTDPEYAEKYMTEVRLVAKPANISIDGVVKKSTNEKFDAKRGGNVGNNGGNVGNNGGNVGTGVGNGVGNGHQLQQLNRQVGEKIGEQLDKPVVTKDHQGADSYHVTLYFATPEAKSENDIRQFVESTGAIVMDYQPASGYWLDSQSQLVGDEFVHVVTVDATPEQLKTLDSKIKNDFKQSSVLITSASDVGGYAGGKVLKYEVPKSEEEIRKLLIELSGKHGGATYLRGNNPQIMTISALSNDEKPEVYYHFT